MEMESRTDAKDSFSDAFSVWQALNQIVSVLFYPMTDFACEFE